MTTSAQIAAATVNTAYAGATLTAANGTAPYTWTITTGSLPAGMSLSTAGAISGTPTQSGAANFTVQVKDSAVPARTATAGLTLNVNQVPSITSVNNATFVAGTAGTFTVTATGFPAPTFSETGGLPSGVTLNATTGVLSGTPGATTGAVYPITITAQNGVTPNATQNFTLTVNQAPVITSSNGTFFLNNALGTFTVTASAFPAATLSLTTGTPPSGVTFNASSGTLSGTPTSVGATPLVFTAANGIGSNATQNFTLTVGSLPVFTSANSTTFTVGTPGTFTVTATGSPAPTFSETGTLPSGVTLTSSGILSGTPAAGTGGTYPITINALNGAPNVTQSFTLTVDEAPSISSANSTTFLLAANGTFTVTAGGFPKPAISETGSLPSPVTFVDNGNGTATLSGTPGSTTAGMYPLTINATNGIGTPAAQSFTLTVSATPPCGAGTESLLNGQYAFTVQGFDGSGNVVLIGGVLTADGTGHLTAGAVDMNLNAGVQTNLAIVSGSNYSIGSDHRGCMAMTTSAGTQNFRFTLGAISAGVASNGHLIDFDATGPFTAGVLRKQNPAAFSTAAISGNYAFGVSAPQDNAGSKFAAMGVLNLSGGGMVTGGSLDFNDYNGPGNTTKLDGVSGSTTWPVTPISILNGGSYTVSGTNGRGTLTFTPNGNTAGHSFLYVVSSTEVLLVSSDARATNGLYAGSAIKQSISTFSNSSLSGKSVLYSSKSTINGGVIDSAITIGIVTTTGGSATFTFAGYNNDSGSVQTPTNNSASGSFSVAASGRTTLTVSGGGGQQTPAFYLYSPGNAFVVFSGSNAESGAVEAQSSTAVSGTYALGNIAPQSVGEVQNISARVFTSPNETGTDDANSQGGSTANTPISNTYSVDSTGVLFIPAGCTPGGTPVTTCSKIGTVISATKFVMFDALQTTNIHPKMNIAEQ